MSKSQEIFLDHFARLGIFTKVQTLAGPPEPQEPEETEQPPEGKFHQPLKLKNPTNCAI